MADLESIARTLLRGGGDLAESARAEAQRVLEELVARGDLGREEAAQIEAAVLDAAETHRQWLEARVSGPLRGAWRGVVEAVRAGAAAESEAAGLGSGGPAAASRPSSDPLTRALLSSIEVRERLHAIEERLERIERALLERDG
jgi:polyhydroxyalkanoate synthesis regulator phasin